MTTAVPKQLQVTGYEFQRTNEVLLDVRHVNLTLGGKVILRDVNAQIRDIERPGVTQGQVVCFLGPSGIGKTQLSRIIAGLQAPTSGSVILRDGQPTGRGKCCMVPQAYPMFDYCTVGDNLSIAGRHHDAVTRQAKAASLIDIFSLQPFVHCYPRELSGGTRQRVAIARQLMCATDYMVMDEPFSGLDPVMKRRATDAIVTLSQLSTYNTIIVVTHDITEGLSVADTVWLMGHETKDGVQLPGARLIEQLDLAEMGFAWHPDLSKDSRFQTFVADIKDRFQGLR